MSKKKFRASVCSFTQELQQRQLIRGLGFFSILTLIITAHLQQKGLFYTPSNEDLQAILNENIPANLQTVISSYPDQNFTEISFPKTPLIQNQNAQNFHLPNYCSTEQITLKNSSFKATAKQAGLTPAEIRNLTQIFGDKLNFKNLHSGDQFKVIVERIPASSGNTKITDNIIGASFSSKNSHYTVVRYENPKTHEINYYQADGRSVSSSFLRYPTHYTHIGSGFSLNRLDPITNSYHAHPGVDFDAPFNTPIYATADARVLNMMEEKGYGKVIRLNHNAHIMTLYGHLHQFASGVHPGSFVKKGQIIGYIGTSGYATGPHVHYELHIDGKAVNPLTCKLPSVNAIPLEQKYNFQQKVKSLAPYLSI